MTLIDFIGTNRRAKGFRADASFIYRCENLAHGVERLGGKTRLVHISNYRPSTDTRVAVFHRPRLTGRYLQKIALLRRAGVVVVADIDDLIVDPSYASASPAVQNQILSIAKVEKQFLSQQRALRLVDLITVSTEPLHAHIGRLFPGKSAVIVPNCVHASWLNLAEETSRNAWKPGQERKILYMPGTRSHDQDFQQVVPALASFLTAHPEVTLDITGHLSEHSTAELASLLAREGCAESLIHSEKVPFEKYAGRFQGGWLNLSPLEASPFNECKSGLKVIEAGFWNLPTLCSPNPDAQRFTEAGAVMANGTDEWLHRLEELLDDNVYTARSEGLREKTLALANIEDSAQIFLGAALSRRPSELFSGFVPKSSSFVPAQLSLARGRRRRKAGRYDAETRLHFEAAHRRSNSKKTVLELLSFQRDLGRPMRKEQASELLEVFSQLSSKDKHRAGNLLVESGHAEALGKIINGEDLQRLSKRSPALCHLWEEREGTSAGRISEIFRNAEAWRRELVDWLEKCGGPVCVIGNAGGLRGCGRGAEIDSHERVVRFNQYRSEESAKRDIGEKVDLWVRAPNLGRARPDQIAPAIAPPERILVSGPDPIFQLWNWDELLPLLSLGPIATIALSYWAQLVDELHAPPSAGLLFLSWAREQLGAEKLVCFGFQLDEGPGPYHQALSRHRGSSRHNWRAERGVLRRWRNLGLRFV